MQELRWGESCEAAEEVQIGSGAGLDCSGGQSASGDEEKAVDSKYILDIGSIRLAAGNEGGLRGRERPRMM